MNHMTEVAKMLGIKLFEEFKIQGRAATFMLTDEGLKFHGNCGWELCDKTMTGLLAGDLKIKHEAVVGAIATDTNAGHKMPLPVKRDERGPVSEKSVKQLLAKVYEEMSELQFAFCAVGIDIDDIGNRMLDNRPPTVPAHIRAVYDEWADVVTALTTLADALGIDADARAAAIERCNKRNQDRGRL